MTIVKAFRFSAGVEWRGGRLTRVTAPGKPALDVATPPEFRGTHKGVWSPEELLVGSVSSCFVVTLAAIAERAGVEVRALEVDGLGHVERAPDGRFRFTAIELFVALDDGGADSREVTRLVKKTEELCLVSLALEVPVHVALAVSDAAA